MTVRHSLGWAFFVFVGFAAFGWVLAIIIGEMM